MRIVLLGASGRTGRLVAAQASQAGHRVTALLRSADTTISRDYEAVVGDPRHLETILGILPGHDAVISVLGPRSRRDGELLPRAAHGIVEAMHRAKVARVVLASSALLYPNVGILGGAVRSLLRTALRGAEEAEKILGRSSLHWTVVRPVRLTNGPITGTYRTFRDRLPDRPQFLARADLAHFLVSEVTASTNLQAIVGICK